MEYRTYAQEAQEVVTTPDDDAKQQDHPPVAMAVIDQGGRVLMTKRLFKEEVVGKGPTVLWSFPSGEVEPGETAEQAAVRETLEELELEVRATTRISERVHPLSPTRRKFVYVACEVVSGTPVIVDHEELAELRWCTLAEADELVAVIGGFDEPVRHHLERVLAGASPEERPSA